MLTCDENIQEVTDLVYVNNFNYNILADLLKSSILSQNLMHGFFCWFQQSLCDVKRSIASLFTAPDQTGVLNAHSLPLKTPS